MARKVIHGGRFYTEKSTRKVVSGGKYYTETTSKDGSAAPTLSNCLATNITANSITPQVDIAF